MNRFLFALLLVVSIACRALAVPQPYPVTIDSQVLSAPSLVVNQAEPYTVRVTFKSGGAVEDVSTAVPFMWWATSAESTNYVTSSWVRVNGGSSGIVVFTFDAAALNYAGDVVYGVGANQTFKQGAMRIKANPYAVGVASPTFTMSTNLAGITFVNAPWIDAASATGFLKRSDAAATYATGTPVYAVSGFATDTTARAWAAAASNLAAAAYPASNPNGYITSADLSYLGTDMTARAWATAASNLALSASQASTDSTARASAATALGQAVIASNLAASAYALASSAATGSPLYVESDPSWVAGTGALWSAIGGKQASGNYATGTPLYVESDPAWTGGTGALWSALAGKQASGNYATGTPLYVIGGAAPAGFTSLGHINVSNGYGVILRDAGNLIGIDPDGGSYSSPFIAFGRTNPAAEAVVLMMYSNRLWVKTATGSDSPLWYGTVDGDGSGLDADLLGGVSHTNYVQFGGQWSNQTIMAQDITADTLVVGAINSDVQFGGYIDMQESYQIYRGDGIWIKTINSGTNIPGDEIINLESHRTSSTALWTNWNSDLLDGLDSSYLLNGANITNPPAAWTAQPSLAALSNGVVAVGATGSNALTTAQAAQAQASNITAVGWSGFAATGTVNLASNTLSGIKRLILTTNGVIGDTAHEIGISSAGLVYFPAPGSARTMYHSGNFSPSTYLTIASAQTNYWRITTVPPSNTAFGSWGQMAYDSTNVYIYHTASNKWLRVPGTLEW